MSCMMLSPAHIATVAHGLSYLLNQSEMCQLSAADELRDALGACRYPHDFLYDDRRIYPVLYRHNEAAYEGRYKAEPDETDEVPAMPDNVPHLLHRLDYNKHYFLDADFFKFLKLLDCYIYQCEEQATADTNLQKALVKTSNHLYASAARSNGFRPALTNSTKHRPPLHPAPLKISTTVTPTARTTKSCACNSSFPESRTMKPAPCSKRTVSGGHPVRALGSASLPQTPNMQRTASWSFWTATKANNKSGHPSRAAPIQSGPAPSSRHKCREHRKTRKGDMNHDSQTAKH